METTSKEMVSTWYVVLVTLVGERSLIFRFESLGFKAPEGINTHNSNNKSKSVSFEKNRYLCSHGIIVQYLYYWCGPVIPRLWHPHSLIIYPDWLAEGKIPLWTDEFLIWAKPDIHNHPYWRSVHNPKLQNTNPP